MATPDQKITPQVGESQAVTPKQGDSPLARLLEGKPVPRRLAIRGALEGGATVVALTDIALLAACGSASSIDITKINTKDQVEIAIITDYNFFFNHLLISQAPDRAQIATTLATSVPTTDEEKKNHTVRKALITKYRDAKQLNGVSIDSESNLSDPQLAMIASRAAHAEQPVQQTIDDVKSMYKILAEIDPSQTNFSDHVTLAINCVSLKDSLKFDDAQFTQLLKQMAATQPGETLHDAEFAQTTPLLVAYALAQKQGKDLQYLSDLANQIQSWGSSDRMPSSNLNGNISLLVLAALLVNGDVNKVQTIYNNMEPPVGTDPQTNPTPYTVNSILTLAAAAVANKETPQTVDNAYKAINNDPMISAQLILAIALQEANLPDFLKAAASIDVISSILNGFAIAVTP